MPASHAGQKRKAVEIDTSEPANEHSNRVSMNARQQSKYDEACRIAKDVNWQVLSTNYVNMTTKMRFKCPVGHVRELVWDTVLRCAECSGTCPVAAAKKFHAAIASQGGRVIGNYTGSEGKVHCQCKDGHDCHPTPHYVQKGGAMCKICTGMCPVEAAKNFARSIAAQGGMAIGHYNGVYEPVHCECKNGHTCYVSPNHIQQGGGICKKCSNRCPVQAAENFSKSIEDLGGTMIGSYSNNQTAVHCVCKNGHECYPTPTNIQKGHGMCLKCVGLCPEEASANFQKAIAVQNGTVVGTYTLSSEPVHCICASGHDCFPKPSSVKQGWNMCIKCSGRCPEEAEAAFRTSVAAKGGRILGAYVRNSDAVHCVCMNGHDCYPKPNQIQQGVGMCIKCAGQCPEEAEKAFKASIIAAGGRVMGPYIRSSDPVHCICVNGHDCHVYPSYIQQGGGMCAKCSNRCSIQAAENFQKAISDLGGRVVGVYSHSNTAVHCVCKNGHDCYPIPSSIQQRQGMCLKCAGHCSEQAGANFHAAIVAQNGQVIGMYTNGTEPVHCICKVGHDCYPIPTHIQQGTKMCIKCSGLCPEEAERAFNASIVAQGGQVIGPYVRTGDAVHCTCALGHDCYPTPNCIQQGKGMCITCAPRSVGEQKTAAALELLGLEFQPEFRFKPDLRRYDFCIPQHKLMIEFDGNIHFKFGCGFIPTEQDLLNKQETDRQKQAIALSRGYRVMRFDYTWAKVEPVKFSEQIRWFIDECKDAAWVSNPEMYHWLFQAAGQVALD